MHVFYLSKQDIDKLLPLVQAALHAGQSGQVGFTDQELALRAALEGLLDPKLSELLAGARVDPGRSAVGLADEDYRENLLALETSSSRCGVALLRAFDGRLEVAVREHEGSQEHAERLLPMANELLADGLPFELWVLPAQSARQAPRDPLGEGPMPRAGRAALQRLLDDGA